MLNQKCSARQQAGRQVGLVGIGINMLLFIAKVIMGLAVNSISVLADAFNNLTDCASALAVLIGFRLCARPADSRHPNGHGRVEYISGFLVSLLMIATAVSFGKRAIIRIMNPQVPDMSLGMIWIPITAIVMKLSFALYVYFADRKVDSATLRAILKDSVSDAVLTGMTILSLILSPMTVFPVDGIASLLISGMILWTGITSFMEHFDLLLGSSGDGTRKEQIVRIILARPDIFDEVLSVNLFDYGPEKQYALIHVMLNPKLEQEETQGEIKQMIQKLKDMQNLEATMYWNSKLGEPYEMLLPNH